MFDLEPIFQFSRHHCVALCAFLVPANLAATIQTIILLVWQRPTFQLRSSATVAIALAMTLFLHIATWFVIGVVTPVSFVLASLGATCTVVNLSLVIFQPSLSQYLRSWKQMIKVFAQ